MADVRSYAGTPTDAQFADMGAPFPGGTPIVVDTTTGLCYTLIGGVVTPITPSGAALTKTDDTNVTLTLGGSPTTALLAATSLTLGWTGTLAASRGGNPAASCAFLAYNSTTDNNVTGNGTAFTCEFDTEVYDSGGDYDNSTDTFTAPATGQYRLGAYVRAQQFTVAADTIQMAIVTSNRTYFFGWNRTNNLDYTNLTFGFMTDADMDASDTATVTYTVTGEATDVIDVLGGSTLQTWFFGARIA